MIFDAHADVARTLAVCVVLLMQAHTLVATTAGPTLCSSKGAVIAAHSGKLRRTMIASPSPDKKDLGSYLSAFAMRILCNLICVQFCTRLETAR